MIEKSMVNKGRETHREKERKEGKKKRTKGGGNHSQPNKCNGRNKW